jgi:hypothetical protein
MLEQAEPLRVRWISLSGSAAHHAQQRCRALSSQLRKASVTESWAPLQQLDLQIVVEEEQIIASCSLVSLLRVAEVVADDIDEAARVPLSIPTRLPGARTQADVPTSSEQSLSARSSFDRPDRTSA